MAIQTRFRGKAWKFGDHVDTDVIVPGKYLAILDPKQLAKICFEGVDPDFGKKVEAGDIVIAGENFGCGSSREHAPVAIKAAGVRVVLAESFARIFFRNAINVGLPALEARGISRFANAGDDLVVNFVNGTVENVKTGKVLVTNPIPPNQMRILEAGGLVDYVKVRLGTAKPKPVVDPDVVEL
jgi:3-isopropylmalate/(R)-2-methylmalate dehydratase small subunit